MTLDQHLLDMLAANGCTNPGCNHQDHDQLYLHSRCHRAAQVIAYHTSDDILEVACAGCKDLICRIAVRERKELTPCHPESPMVVEYTRGRGTVRIHCFQCKRLLAEIPLQAMVRATLNIPPRH